MRLKMKNGVSGTGVELFPWSSLYETGIKAIDFQNRSLVRLVNRIAWQIVSKSNSSSISPLLDSLVDCMQIHHAHEERIWRECIGDDLWLVSHSKSHSEFTKTMSGIGRASLRLSHEIATEIALKTISEWLVKHLMECDKLMSKVVCNLHSEASLSRAKELAVIEMASVTNELVGEFVAMQISIVNIVIKISNEASMSEAVFLSEKTKSVA